MSHKPPRKLPNERSHLYLVTTSSGYPAIWDATTCNLIIVSADEAETRKVLARMLKPEKEKLPWKKSLADQVEEMLNKKDKAERKTRPKVFHPRPNRSKVEGRLADPAVQAALAGVTAHDNHYFKDGVPYHLSEILIEIIGVKGSAASRLIAAAWELGILRGTRPLKRGVKKPRLALGLKKRAAL